MRTASRVTRPVQLIAVPYDSGHRGVRLGAGPLHFLANGAPEALRATGIATDVRLIEAETEFNTEIGTSFDLHRSLSHAVASAVGNGALPIVLAGNCGSAVGTVSGIRGGDASSNVPGTEDEIGIVWFDAHGDLNTPESTTTGFLDGMALATLTGRCWTALAQSVPGFRPVPDEHVILAGARDIDSAEGDRLRGSAIAVASAGTGADSLVAALDELRNRVSRIYVHLDLDVHDAREVVANGYAQPGGFGIAELLDAVVAIGERFTVAGVGLTAYDPAFDTDGRMLAAGLGLMVAAAKS